MELERLGFFSAVAFLNSGLSNDDNSALNCLHVRVVKDVVYMTASNGIVWKRARLVIPNTTQEAAKGDQPGQKFLIPSSTLGSFQTLIGKHKAKAKKLQKKDLDYLHITISPTRLESFGVVIEYSQPACDFQEMDNKFESKISPAGNILLPVGQLIDSVLKGFDKSKPVQAYFNGEKGPVHFHQEVTEFEAIVNPAVEEEKGDEEKKSESKKK